MNLQEELKPYITKGNYAREVDGEFVQVSSNQLVVIELPTLLQLINRIGEEVIGPDEDDTPTISSHPMLLTHGDGFEYMRNKVRVAQRQRLSQLTGKDNV